MKVLTSQGVTSAVGEPHDLSWPEFCQLVRSYSVARVEETGEEKRSAPWFSPAEYRRNHRRRENILGRVWAICADLDAISDPLAVEKSLSRWEYIAWTTWSSTPEEQRWRIVLPIAGGIDVERFGHLVGRVLGVLGKAATLDKRSETPEQLWFFPWHKKSQSAGHRVWVHRGRWIKEGIKVDFTGVKLAHKAEEVGKGERNNTLVIRLSETDALRCQTKAELMEIAEAWNVRLKTPMAGKEVRDIVRKKWNWMQRGEGLVRRAEAWRGVEIEIPKLWTGLLSNKIRGARIPESYVGDFIFPGAALLSAKAKEGKSFLSVQLALAIATGKPFLNGAKYPGFAVHKKAKAMVIAGEDSSGGIKKRYHGSIASGHLPTPEHEEDVAILTSDDLDEYKRIFQQMGGLTIFEKLVERWYQEGYRVIMIDPLRVLEGILGISEYPGGDTPNAHTRDFATMRYYTRLGQRYEDLAFVISMHHGKNKRDHDASDPADMISTTSGTTGGTLTTLALLRAPEQMEAPEVQGVKAERREFFVGGRDTRTQRYLLEQSPTTGIWSTVGNLRDEMTSEARGRYFEAMLGLGADRDWVPVSRIASTCKVTPRAIHQVISRGRNETYKGYRLMVKHGPKGGFRLVR